MINSFLYIFTLLNLFTLYGIGTSISIIGAVRERNAKSPGKCVILIVVGASIIAAAGLLATIMGRFLGD